MTSTHPIAAAAGPNSINNRLVYDDEHSVVSGSTVKVSNTFASAIMRSTVSLACMLVTKAPALIHN
jgi:hypothetical protein